MSKLDELIRELCPDGVRYRVLSDVLMIKNGRDYKSYAEGGIPVYGSGGIMTYIDTAAYDKPSVLIPRKGSLDKLYYVDTPFWNVDTIFYTEINEKIVVPKFVFYCLQMLHLEQLNKSGGVPSLTQSVLGKVRIPVPPLEVQREIVRILDSFIALTAELQAELQVELQVRRQQYEYYRDQLLNFSPEKVEYKNVGDVCSVLRGKRLTSKELIAHGEYPVIHGGTSPMGYYDRANRKSNTTIVINTGNAGNVFFIDKAFWSSDACFALYPDARVLDKFLYYVVSSQESILHSKVRSGAMPTIDANAVKMLRIPVPSLDVQSRIIHVLDRFDSICNDLSVGLPAEIVARQKQFEYYRDKLLTFKEV